MVTFLEEKDFDDSSLKKIRSRIDDDLKRRDEAVNVKTELESKISKAKEKEGEGELEEILSKAEDVLKELDKQIASIDDFIKRERAIYESLRTLTLIRKVSSIIGGFLLFFSGILLTLSIFVVARILTIPPTPTAHIFIGYLLLVASIVMLISGTIHQVV